MEGMGVQCTDNIQCCSEQSCEQQAYTDVAEDGAIMNIMLRGWAAALGRRGRSIRLWYRPYSILCDYMSSFVPLTEWSHSSGTSVCEAT